MIQPNLQFMVIGNSQGNQGCFKIDFPLIPPWFLLSLNIHRNLWMTNHSLHDLCGCFRRRKSGTTFSSIFAHLSGWRTNLGYRAQLQICPGLIPLFIPSAPGSQILFCVSRLARKEQQLIPYPFFNCQKSQDQTSLCFILFPRKSR